ncbi:hypothetical protein GCM10027447_12670 [Glycomyces halotolerans]
MRRVDVTDLVAYMTQLQPAQRVDEYTATAWFDVLGDVPATLDQAREATANVAKRERWIFPSAIREELLAILQSANPPAPAPARAIPGRYDVDEDRAVRARRGAQRVREALAAAKRHPAAQAREEELTEKEQRLRDAVAAHRAGQRTRATRPLSDAARVDPSRLVSQFKQIPERTDR